MNNQYKPDDAVARFKQWVNDYCTNYKSFNVAQLRDLKFRESVKIQARKQVSIEVWLRCYLISFADWGFQGACPHCLKMSFALSFLLEKFQTSLKVSVSLPVPKIPKVLESGQKLDTLDYPHELVRLSELDANIESIKTKRSRKSLTPIVRKVSALEHELSTGALDGDAKAQRRATRQLNHQNRKVSGILSNKALELKQSDLTSFERLARPLTYKTTSKVVTQKIESDEKIYFRVNEVKTISLVESKQTYKRLMKFYCFDCKLAFNNRSNKSAYKTYLESGLSELFCKHCQSNDVRIFDDFGHLSRKSEKIDL